MPVNRAQRGHPSCGVWPARTQRGRGWLGQGRGSGGRGRRWPPAGSVSVSGWQRLPGAQLRLPPSSLVPPAGVCPLRGFWELAFLLCPSGNWRLPGAPPRARRVHCSPLSSSHASSLLPLPSCPFSALPGGGGVGAAAVAGSEAVPKLPESGQSEPEPPGVEGGAEAAGNDHPWEPGRAERPRRAAPCLWWHGGPRQGQASCRVRGGPRQGEQPVRGPGVRATASPRSHQSAPPATGPLGNAASACAHCAVGAPPRRPPACV